ncbi:DNA adenine methylase [Muricauda sp. SCSIO 64092]|uniref:DNA adenine methylase n=1 Tax=Allomuricauda sp. SCSIO 64092 TaxID=2908842 RepID=UPI001FF22690|nr:DNA adenine methylase [Muricauda sp. SCSIO 64092]UOY07743.1 DNA adenine methylase [Muricauda sp. SCSIO 64092]
MRTPVKYYGGKTRMLKHLLPMIPKHRIYVEPFCGGASLFWAKEPSKIEVLNDINGNVVNFYQTVQSNFSELDERIQGSLHCEHSFNYAKLVYHNPSKFSKVERAWAFWVSCNQSFAAEAAGSFQWVKNKHDNWHPAVSVDNRKKEFPQYRGRLNRVCIMDRDAVQMIADRDGGDTFFYLDPPYVGARQGHYKGYSQENFNELLYALAEVKGKFLLSSYHNAELDLIKAEYNWSQMGIDQRLGVSGGTKRKTEVLTWNY